MKTSTTLLVIFAILCFLVAFGVQGKIVNSSYQITLDGDQEVPPSGSNAQGTGSMQLDKKTRQLSFNINHNVQGALAAHVHVAPKGENGDVIIAFETATSPIQGSLEITDDIAERLVRDECYVNIHTEANPEGEIRGQILLETIEAIAKGVIVLDGAQQVPPNNETDFTGDGTIFFSNFTDVMTYEIFHDVDEPTMGHIHIGEAGTNGGVVHEFASPQSPIIGNWTGIQGQNEVALLGNGLYVNIHTEENPDGEIRGQIIITEFLTDLERDEESDDDDGLSGGAIFGIVFSVLLLTGAAVAGIAYMWQKEQRKRAHREASTGGYVKQNDVALLDDQQPVEVGEFHAST
mmetsp:Transcript_13193/g.19891  ORF Transcript_13193/g.19891 Transcript_13193/m.19891 type:complete len:348 (+) Transcript_13193:27-1070(+)|eukprot:CAMPEP_0201551804 /NCGR_PEP_ID=MMETSP0173_2-20130828/10269_1 /ASSEMBLY_ACC=CAM_ASM_000268 /TAXON_ID=218659 /ORGANISM="Vexillifera sp., Strain DIVA3 564/2" /LENGTH=347 /DNA_ID=CAMNT_0047962141 /DNA_START=18 /DNA_END=1061 /DNA_ORIENTATION=+